MGLHFSGDLGDCAWSRLFAQGNFQTFEDGAAADLADGGSGNQQGLGDLFLGLWPCQIIFTVIGQEEDAGTRLYACRSVAFANQIVEVLSLVSGQGDEAMLAHARRIAQSSVFKETEY